MIVIVVHELKHSTFRFISCTKGRYIMFQIWNWWFAISQNKLESIFSYRIKWAFTVSSHFIYISLTLVRAVLKAVVLENIQTIFRMQNYALCKLFQISDEILLQNETMVLSLSIYKFDDYYRHFNRKRELEQVNDKWGNNAQT